MLKNIYKDVIKDFGTRTFNDIQSRAPEIKANNKFSLLTEDIQNYIDDVTADKVVMISETTKKDIKRIVAKAIQEGKSIPETEMMIDGLYLDQIIPNRSKTIARTEVVSASNYGSIAGAKQTTSKLNKIWIPTFDDSTRESHLAMANHPPIALDAMFDVGGFYGQQPGDFSLPASEVINCRCAIGYDYAGFTEEQPTVQFPTNPTPIIQNPLFPDEIAGVKRGEEMTRDEANHGKPNPNFSKGGGYTINCQSCVVAFEARLRGYNVKTLPNTSGSTLEKLSKNPALAWIDPQSGLNPNYIFDEKINTAKQLLKFVEDTVKKGERYTIQFHWKGKDMEGHIISLDRKDNGELRLYDPQSGKNYSGINILRYFNKIKFQITRFGTKMKTPAKLIRIDDKMFNEIIVNDILERELP